MGFIVPWKRKNREGFEFLCMDALPIPLISNVNSRNFLMYERY